MSQNLIDVDLAGMPAPHPMDVKGTDFPLVVAGNGEPILFVHGAWADHRIWCGLWKPISRHAKFLAYTQRHFGNWNWPDEKPYARRIHTEDLINLLEVLEYPVHLAGFHLAQRLQPGEHGRRLPAGGVDFNPATRRRNSLQVFRQSPASDVGDPVHHVLDLVVR